MRVAADVQDQVWNRALLGREVRIKVNQAGDGAAAGSSRLPVLKVERCLVQGLDASRVA